jgi:hypothetical protein
MENNVDMQRYQEFVKNPSLFVRKPDGASR